MSVQTLADQMHGGADQDPWAQIGETMGQAMTYTPESGDPSTVTGTFTEDMDLTEETNDGWVRVRRGTALVAVDDIASVGSEGDQMTIGGATWDVVGLGMGGSYAANGIGGLMAINVIRRTFNRKSGAPRIRRSGA